MNREVMCPYCANPAELVDSAEVYGGYSYGQIWLCRPCWAWVGVHKNSPTFAPLGRIANAELRGWKVRAHAAFDPLWKLSAVVRNVKPQKARMDGYAWLAGKLGIKLSDCHIGMFDEATCIKVVTICMIETDNIYTAR